MGRTSSILSMFLLEPVADQLLANMHQHPAAPAVAIAAVLAVWS